MKHIITCICVMFAAGLLAQSSPISSSQARKINMSRSAGKTTLGNTAKTMTDSNPNEIAKSDMGVRLTKVDEGLAILGFIGNSTAQAANLKNGDIIMAVNNVKVGTLKEFDTVISGYDPGDVVTIDYMRGDRELTKNVRLNRK